MTLRSVVLAILSLLALIFLILNWQGITASVPVNLIVEEIQAPLGLILLVILGGLWLFGIAWALMQQASTLVEIRKAYKEANANKSLADHAEQSRLEQTKESLRQEMVKNREELLAGIKAAVEVPTTSAVNAQKRLEAVEKALEKLSLRIEQIADKAQIGPAPELPAPEPKKSGFFGFLPFLLVYSSTIALPRGCSLISSAEARSAKIRSSLCPQNACTAVTCGFP